MQTQLAAKLASTLGLHIRFLLAGHCRKLVIETASQVSVKAPTASSSKWHCSDTNWQTGEGFCSFLSSGKKDLKRSDCVRNGWNACLNFANLSVVLKYAVMLFTLQKVQLCAGLHRTAALSGFRFFLNYW